MIKDPFVFEFLGVPEKKPLLEKDLEYKLIKPIGIILCAEKDNVVVEYSMGGLNNNLFASKYTYYIPKQEELIAQVEQVIKENEKETNDENK